MEVKKRTCKCSRGWERWLSVSTPHFGNVAVRGGSSHNEKAFIHLLQEEGKGDWGQLS